MDILEQVETSYVSLKGARRAKERLARVRIAREMEQLTDEFDALVLKASEHGFKVSRIARAMGASRTTVYQILERAKGAAPAAETLLSVEQKRYTVTEGGLRITLDAGDVAEILPKLGWNADTLQTFPGLLAGDFDVMERADGSTLLAPVVDFMPEHGKRHPVAEWAYAPEHETEALAWWQAQQTEGAAA